MCEEEQRQLYFAYGSNLWSGRVGQNNRTVKFKAIGKIKDYKIEFSYPSQRWRGSTANIIEEKDSEVWGVVWTVSENDLADLDKQEGVTDGIYQKMTLEVETQEGELLNCIGYCLTPSIREQYVSSNEELLPSLAYKEIIIRGAKENSLPEEYIENTLQNAKDNGYNGPVEIDSDLTATYIESTQL